MIEFFLELSRIRQLKREKELFSTGINEPQYLIIGNNHYLMKENAMPINKKLYDAANRYCAHFPGHTAEEIYRVLEFCQKELEKENPAPATIGDDAYQYAYSTGYNDGIKTAEIFIINELAFLLRNNADREGVATFLNKMKVKIEALVQTRHLTLDMAAGEKPPQNIAVKVQDPLSNNPRISYHPAKI
jgi:hypothetical protein